MRSCSLPVLVHEPTEQVVSVDLGRLVHAFASHAMSQGLPNAKVVSYSDGGHAFLVQHANDFGREVLNFLC